MDNAKLRRRQVIGALGVGGLAAASRLLSRPAVAQAKPERLVLLGTPGGWINSLRQEVIPAWEREYGIGIESSFLGVDPLRTKLRTDFGGGTAPYDLVVWTAEWRGWIQQYLEDLEKLLAANKLDGKDFDWNDFAKPALEFASFRGKQIGVPYRATAMMLDYQKAVLAQAGITKPPGTFEELQVAAEAAMKQSAGQDERTRRYGLGIFGKQGGAIVNGWIPYLFSTDGRLYDEKTYEIFVNDSRAVESLQFYGDLVNKYKVTPPEAMTWEWDEITAGGQNDRYAMAIMHAPYAAALDDPKASKTVGKWGWSQMPGAHRPEQGRSWILGWSMSVPSSSRNREWAARFVQYACARQPMLKSMQGGNLPPRASVLSDPAISAQFPWAPMGSLALERAWQVPGDEAWDALESRLRTGISVVLLGQATAKQSLDQVADDWLRTLRRAGLRQ
jgi:ABC-type glycerol-3-phosphate transport system substrate-binding protein